MTINNYKQKATGHVTSLANGHFTGSEARFVCKIPTASSNKKRYNFTDTGLAVGNRPEALLQLRNVSSVRVVFRKRHKTDAYTKMGGTYYECCMYPTDSAWLAFLTPFLLLLPVSGQLSRGFYCTRNKACLLCATPAGTCRVQSPGFPKIVYYEKVRLHQKYNLKIKGEWAERPAKPAVCMKGNMVTLHDWVIEFWNWEKSWEFLKSVPTVVDSTYLLLCK